MVARLVEPIPELFLKAHLQSIIPQSTLKLYVYLLQSLEKLMPQNKKRPTNQEPCSRCALAVLALCSPCARAVLALCTKRAHSTYDQLVHSPPQDPPDHLGRHSGSCQSGGKVSVNLDNGIRVYCGSCCGMWPQ